MLDPRLFAVREALSSPASAPEAPVPTAEGVIEAAVAVILRGRPEDLELLLIKRATDPRDPWSGHMALPGGRRDPEDPDLAHTAMRETMEETGIVLHGDAAAHPLGLLPLVAPVSAPIPRIRISPFVFAVAPDTPARAASPEVARVHWTALGRLRDPASRDRIHVPLPGGSRTFPCVRVHGEVVWGLTYRILTDFLGRLDGR